MTRVLPPRDPKTGRFISKANLLRRENADELQRITEEGKRLREKDYDIKTRPPRSKGHAVDERRMGLNRGVMTSRPYGPSFQGSQEWVRHPATDPYQAHTYYMVVQVEASARGIAYEYEDIDADAPDQFATIALTGVTRDGRVRGLKYAELVRDFPGIAARAIRRAGVYPKGSLKESVVAVFRHKEK